MFCCLQGVWEEGACNSRQPARHRPHTQHAYARGHRQNFPSFTGRPGSRRERSERRRKGRCLLPNCNFFLLPSCPYAHPSHTTPVLLPLTKENGLNVFVHYAVCRTVMQNQSPPKPTIMSIRYMSVCLPCFSKAGIEGTWKVFEHGPRRRMGCSVGREGGAVRQGQGSGGGRWVVGVGRGSGVAGVVGQAVVGWGQ